MDKIYGSPPVKIKEIKLDPSEMMFYQYLPIKLKGSIIVIPKPLSFASDVILEAIKDFKNNFDLQEYYVYVTLKSLYITSGNNLNRPGWHSDGFGTEDINYIWCDTAPTEYIEGEFKNVPTDCEASLEHFRELGWKSKIKTVDVNTLYRLDETVVHTTSAYIGPPRVRTFIKISFSRDKYNLKGNSHNYGLDYQWDMVERSQERNHPSK